MLVTLFFSKNNFITLYYILIKKLYEKHQFIVQDKEYFEEILFDNMNYIWDLKNQLPNYIESRKNQTRNFFNMLNNRTLRKTWYDYEKIALNELNKYRPCACYIDDEFEQIPVCDLGIECNQEDIYNRLYLINKYRNNKYKIECPKIDCYNRDIQYYNKENIYENIEYEKNKYENINSFPEQLSKKEHINNVNIWPEIENSDSFKFPNHSQKNLSVVEENNYVPNINNLQTGCFSCYKRGGTNDQNYSMYCPFSCSN